jgi:hypothetical protein
MTYDTILRAWRAEWHVIQRSRLGALVVEQLPVEAWEQPSAARSFSPNPVHILYKIAKEI